MIEPDPPEVTMPAMSWPRSAAASPCIKSRAMAMTSPSKRVALGHMSRWRMFMCPKSPKTSFMNP